MQVSGSVQNEFGKFAAINVVSHAELFGGKICAALDRQHPRDLFDVHLLLENEGYTNDVKIGFLAALLSHMRSMSEILQPHFLDQQLAFENQFTGMASIPFTYQDFEVTRKRLISVIHSQWTSNDRNFLLSFKQGKPDWNLLPNEEIKNLPAVNWKLENINKLIRENPKKLSELLETLKINLSEFHK
jgi:hypothetical protein